MFSGLSCWWNPFLDDYWINNRCPVESFMRAHSTAADVQTVSVSRGWDEDQSDCNLNSECNGEWGSYLYFAGLLDAVLLINPLPSSSPERGITTCNHHQGLHNHHICAPDLGILYLPHCEVLYIYLFSKFLLTLQSLEKNVEWWQFRVNRWYYLVEVKDINIKIT